MLAEQLYDRRFTRLCDAGRLFDLFTDPWWFVQPVGRDGRVRRGSGARNVPDATAGGGGMVVRWQMQHGRRGIGILHNLHLIAPIGAD